LVTVIVAVAKTASFANPTGEITVSTSFAGEVGVAAVTLQTIWALAPVAEAKETLSTVIS